MLPSRDVLFGLHTSGGGTQSYRQIAAMYGVTEDTIRSRIKRYRKNLVPAVVLKKDNQPLDWERWQDTLSTLRTRGYISVAHVCDVHFPDHDENALALAYELIRRNQPDVIVVGSDTADFGAISSFTPDPDENEAYADVLDNFNRYWKTHIDRLKTVAPAAALVFIMGNHEQRLYDFVANNAPKLRRTVEQAWIESVSYQGRVMWIGHTQEVEIGNLLVIHGNRHNEHVAKSLLEDASYQMSIMAGHVHRLTSYARSGRKYAVAAVTSGCLCQLHPIYMKGKSMRRAWQHGTCFATVEMRSMDVWLNNIEFRQSPRGIVAVSGGEWIEIERQA